MHTFSLGNQNDMEWTPERFAKLHRAIQSDSPLYTANDVK